LRFEDVTVPWELHSEDRQIRSWPLSNLERLVEGLTRLRPGENCYGHRACQVDTSGVLTISSPEIVNVREPEEASIVRLFASDRSVILLGFATASRRVQLRPDSDCGAGSGDRSPKQRRTPRGLRPGIIRCSARTNEQGVIYWIFGIALISELAIQCFVKNRLAQAATSPRASSGQLGSRRRSRTPARVWRDPDDLSGVDLERPTLAIDRRVSDRLAAAFSKNCCREKGRIGAVSKGRR